MFLIEEETTNLGLNSRKDGLKAVNSCSILDGFAEKISIAPFFNDVLMDGCRFSDVVLSIQQIWQVGEVKSHIDLVIFEPIIKVLVSVVFELNSRNEKENSTDLAKPSNSPITKFDFFASWIESSNMGEIWCSYGIRSFVISFDSRKFFDIMFDSPPKSKVFVLVRVQLTEIG